MAELRNGEPSRLNPAGISALVFQLLTFADAILKLFGRRRTDRPQRDRASSDPEGPDAGAAR